MGSACCVWDLTNINEELPEIDDVKELFREHCKAWAFQKEEGEEGGRVHLQARISLKIKNRQNFMIKTFPGWHVSITSNQNRGNMFYVMKTEGRLEGPWTDQDKVPMYVPRQIRKIDKLHPWQEYVIADRLNLDDRAVNVVVDPKGNNGKSTLAQFILVHGIGRALPFSNDFRDISRMVMCTEKKPLYIIDIPRALRKDQMRQFWAGVEQLKGGYAWDDRFTFKEQVFDSPSIWVFMNSKPDRNTLTRDRWKLWEITSDLELVQLSSRSVSASSASSSDADSSK